MSRRKRILFFAKNVMRMASILTLIIDRHEVGYAVLMGYEEWPTAEDLRILKFDKGKGADFGVKVQCAYKLSVEERYLYEFASVENLIAFINKFGGHEKITETVREYAEKEPDNMKLLKDIATKNLTHRSLDEIAADNFMDVKTLKVKKEQIIHELAFRIVYGEKFSELTG